MNGLLIVCPHKDIPDLLDHARMFAQTIGAKVVATTDEQIEIISDDHEDLQSLWDTYQCEVVLPKSPRRPKRFIGEVS